MNKTLLYLAVLSAITTPAMAFEIKEIGTLVADFEGEVIAQPTVRITDRDEVETTAFLHLIGPTSSLSLSGFSLDNARLGINVTFLSERPDAGTPPLDVEISYSPTGNAQQWIAYEAPGLDNIDFTTLTFEGDKGHVTGTFSAKLCYSESYEEDADMNNCRPIEGSFDTPIEIER